MCVCVFFNFFRAKHFVAFPMCGVSFEAIFGKADKPTTPEPTLPPVSLRFFRFFHVSFRFRPAAHGVVPVQNHHLPQQAVFVLPLLFFFTASPAIRHFRCAAKRCGVQWVGSCLQEGTPASPLVSGPCSAALHAAWASRGGQSGIGIEF